MNTSVAKERGGCRRKEMENKERLTTAERQRRYYERHKEARKAALRKQGLTTYTKYHKRYFDKKRKEGNGE